MNPNKHLSKKPKCIPYTGKLFLLFMSTAFITVLIANQMKYLALYLDQRRCESIDRYKMMKRLLDKRTELTVTNKRKIFNTCSYMKIRTPKPYGTAKRINLNQIQTLTQSTTANTPFYISNLTIHIRPKDSLYRRHSLTPVTSRNSRPVSHYNLFNPALSFI